MLQNVIAKPMLCRHRARLVGDNGADFAVQKFFLLRRAADPNLLVDCMPLPPHWIHDLLICMGPARKCPKKNSPAPYVPPYPLECLHITPLITTVPLRRCCVVQGARASAGRTRNGGRAKPSTYFHFVFFAISIVYIFLLNYF